MGLFNSKNIGDIFSSVAKNVKESSQQIADSAKKYSAESKEANKPIEGALARYGVIYLGGLSEYPKKRSSEIGFNVMPESFYFKPTVTSKEWFEEMVIPYKRVTKFEIVTRQLSSSELFLTDDARGLQQDNNIHITYTTEEGSEVLLRLEMMTGITVAGQAIKCREMMDLLRQQGILPKLNQEASSPASANIPEQIAKLNELRVAGIITEEEFNAKKSELLSKI